MGVFKWLRRERVTVTTHHNEPDTDTEQLSRSATHVGTIRTEEYKQDLAEFQARRSFLNKELPETPDKKKCGRHSLPVSCTDCASTHDNTFNYEKKSAVKYKKKSHRRSCSANSNQETQLGQPNIHFLFQNQVFMPGNIFATATYSEPHRTRRQKIRRSSENPDLIKKEIDFNQDQKASLPLFYKNNSLPYDLKNFLDCSNSGEEEVDGAKTSLSSSDRKGNSSDDKLSEVMSELRHLDQWADEQLEVQNVIKSDDSKSDTSAHGLPVASASNLDVSVDRQKVWQQGKWGVVPVQVKKLPGISIDHVKRKQSMEINILRKCRHPNIILLMGLYADVQSNVHMICEHCVDSLHGILHVQGRILSAQTAVHYVLDIVNALLFLRMQGYLHTELSSHSIMVTAHDTAKLADLGPCARLPKPFPEKEKLYDLYSPEPQYVNIEDTRQSTTTESEPLISKHSSETYLATDAVPRPHRAYRHSERYRWHAPELFSPDADGLVYPCAKSDVYSLALVLWESCNASVPWKSLTYEKLKELYTLWNTGIRLPQDGTYPGCLLALLQAGLKLSRSERLDLGTMQSTLVNVKRNIEDLEYIVIPARLSKKKSDFSSTAWDSNSPTDDSEYQSPVSKNVQHEAVIHKSKISSTDSSEKETKSESSPLYETILHEKYSPHFAEPEKCYVSDDENVEERPILKYEHLPDKDFSSACSTPIAKIRARIKDVGTPGVLHRSDSTEYCSILSPDQRKPYFNDCSKDSAERPNAKLSRSFTPKSYKPLHIKVPECNLESLKSILKDQSGSERGSYNFDVKNYSLPSTPIARSNKLRKNAWLSGEWSASQRSSEKSGDISKLPEDDCSKKVQSAPETPMLSNSKSLERDQISDLSRSYEDEGQSSHSFDNRDNFTGLRRVDPPQDFTPGIENFPRERTSSWSFKSSADRPSAKFKIEDDILANINVKPLVAIHERWIYEANKKTGRSMSLPEDNRCHISAVKPASHCVDTLQKSLPQLNLKKSTAKTYRSHPVSPSGNSKSGIQWEQFCQAREAVAKNINFSRDPDRFNTLKKDSDKETITEEETRSELMIDQATDTNGIEDFIRELIRKEFQHLLHEISDDASSPAPRSEEFLNKGVANILENLTNGEDAEQTSRKDPVKSFSRVKINGNNKPLLQITFSRTGENSLQVLDNCVNVTIRDANTSGREKLNLSLEDTLTADDVQVHSLKRCQAFSAIQEARSTEDLYIDDELSTHMQENFGRVKLIPLHGSLHEILCEKEDDCCLIKVKQENGCDTIYFRCDNSDTESRDAIDGATDGPAQDTVVFKRSISLIEERIQRFIPKDKRALTPVLNRRAKRNEPLTEAAKTRPKSEILVQKLNEQSRVLSNSSPSLTMKGDKNDEVEINLENAMCYQDSSSDECIKCQMETDDFELLEQKIEEDLAKIKLSPLTCGCLEKISEENLSALNEEGKEK